MVSAHAVSAPPRRPGLLGGAVAAWAWVGALLALVLESQAIAASPAEAVLRQLQSGAGVAATERNATDLALLARFYEERQLRPLWITGQAATRRAHALTAILEKAQTTEWNKYWEYSFTRFHAGAMRILETNAMM